MTDPKTITEYENFHGFGTVRFYESECRKAGQEVRRLPCTAADGAACVVLLTLCPSGAPGSYDGVDVITADESHCLYSGSARHDGTNLSSQLAAHGFTLVPAEPSPEHDLPALKGTDVDGVSQFSLF